ncbi:MAG: tetratricopeptide repeat protein [Acidimicrobiales bacterium]
MATPTLDEAMRLERAGDLDGVVIVLEGVLDRSPSNPGALTHLARVQLERGRLSEAASALDRAEAATGTTPATARLRGDLSYKGGRWEQAARAYQDAGALGDKGTWSLVQLARCQVRLGDVEGARGTALRAAERDAGSVGAWVVLGDLAAREGRMDEAEKMYGCAHDHAPDDPWAYAKLVEARLLRLPPERRDAEVKVLLKTTGRDNKHLLGVLAKLRSQQGDHEAAARAWGDRARSTGDLYARKMEGYALRKAGKVDEAAAVLGQCLVRAPDDLILFRTYVGLQRKRGAIEELRRTLEEALPGAGGRRGAFIGELRKLPADPTA